MPLPLIGAALGLAGGIGSVINAGRANRKLEDLKASNPAYAANPLAKQRFELANTLLNARAPGAVFRDQNILANQANMLGTLDRNATSGSQVLATAAGINAGTNQAFLEGANQDVQDYQRRFSNYSGALEGQINEQDKEYQDRVRRFQDATQIEATKNANNQSAWNSLSNLGFAAMNFGLAGGDKALFGGGGGATTAPGMAGGGIDLNMLRPDYRTVWRQTH